MAAFAGQLDAEAWPLVVLKPTAYPTKDSLEGLDVALGELLDRGERFCLLGDLSHKNGMELHEVQHLQALFEEQGERLDRQVVAFGLAIPSAMVRGGMRLVLRARQPRFPTAVHRSRREASRYLAPFLTELSLPVAVGH
ncbi:MAG: hypothetical protein H6712_26565 [Myxococcales bacterium]|nr:hypothetical protein [Myxococcales bacterium]